MRWEVESADDKLAQYWDNRNNPNLDPRTRATINNYIKGTLHKLYKDARSVPDPVVSGDVNAVIASMRSGHGKIDAAQPAPDFGRLSDNELNKYSLATFGYRAI